MLHALQSSPNQSVDDGCAPACARSSSAMGASITEVAEATTRYDHARKLLTFLLACHDCGIEKVIDTLDYEPRFEPA